jgi:hypothetical protein
MPAIFTLIAIAGLLMSSASAGTISFAMLYGGTTITAISAIASVAGAIRHHKFSWLQYLNVVLLALMALFFVGLAVVLLTWHRFGGFGS